MEVHKLNFAAGDICMLTEVIIEEFHFVSSLCHLHFTQDIQNKNQKQTVIFIVEENKM